MKNLKLCITCLQDEAEFYSIYETDIVDEDKVHSNYAEMLSLCTNISISSISGLSNVICIDCVRLLKIAYMFRTQADIAMEGLKDLLYTPNIFMKDPLPTTGFFAGSDPNNRANSDDINECNDESPSSGNLNMDLNTRFQKKRTKKHYFKLFSCLQCPEQFFGESAVSDHVTEKHCPLDSMVCRYCGESYNHREQYLNHVQQCLNVQDEMEPASCCPTCELSFDSTHEMENHLLTHEILHRCRFCDQEFSNQYEMKRHCKSHTARKIFLCDLCGAVLARQVKFKTHMDRHLGIKPFPCSMCKKMFTTKNEVTVHERYHTGEKTVKCEICGKDFMRRNALVIHMRIHTGEKPYKCHHCEKSFTQSHDLKLHIRRHTGERLKCHLCTLDFVQKYHLTRHLRAAHGLDVQSVTGRLSKT